MGDASWATQRVACHDFGLYSQKTDDWCPQPECIPISIYSIMSYHIISPHLVSSTPMMRTGRSAASKTN
eukprot:scaffold493028_cov25-Prasinocladus_malaysianus.AAC.1